MALLLATAATHWASRANARDAEPVDLTWDAAEECPSKDAVLARMHQIAGPAQEPFAPLRAEATITALPRGSFHLRLVTHSGKLVGVRDLDGKSCQALAGITAFWLAILLNPGALPAEASAAQNAAKNAPEEQPPAPEERPDEQEKSRRPPPRTLPTRAAPLAPSSQPLVSPRAVHRLLLLPLGALSFGPLRLVSRGLAAGAGVSIDGWRVFAEGVLWSSQKATVPRLLDEYTVDLERFSLGLRSCRHVWGTRLEVAACVALSLQHISARGSGPNLASETARQLWAAAGAGIQARFLAAPWFGVVLGVDAELESARPVIQLAGVGTVEHLGPAATKAIFGGEWIF